MTATDTEQQPRYIEYRKLEDIRRAARNPKGHHRAGITASVAEHGFVEPPTLDERTGALIAGHGRLDELERARAAGEAPPEGVIVGDDGSWYAPLVRGWASKDDDDAESYLIGSNYLVEAGGWEADLATMLGELRDRNLAAFRATGHSDESLAALMADLAASHSEAGVGGGGAPPAPSVTLVERFGVPPFSVLDARQGYWQDRKRRWLEVGIRSELGRPKNLLKMSEQALTGYQQPNRSVPASDSGNDPQFYYKKRIVERDLGRELTTEEFLADWYEGPDAYVGGTSIFDPVLCELAYRWWCPEGGRVLDPFAGGSVRGVIAGILGRSYTGIELRGEQVTANVEQRDELCPDADVVWIDGDSREELPRITAPADFLFSCPPYFDLEQYGDDPADLSTMTWEQFGEAYTDIITKAVGLLADDSFACFVVSEIRDPQGRNRGFLRLTEQAFEAAGAAFYNDAVLVTAVGSLALRAARIFVPGRKLARAHQNVLVFVKGDPARAAARAQQFDPDTFATIEEQPQP